MTQAPASIPEAALARLRAAIQAVLEETKTELPNLPLGDQLRIGGLILREAGCAYFADVNVPATLAGGYEPARQALALCLWKAAVYAHNANNPRHTP